MTGHPIAPRMPASAPARQDRPTLAPDPGRGAGHLLPGERVAWVDSGRTSFALVAVVAIAFVLLNLIVYQSVRARLIGERWDQMVLTIADKQQDVNTLLQSLRHDCRVIANEPLLVAAVAAGVDTSRAAGGAAPAAVGDELDRVTTAFDLLGVDVVRADGAVLFGSDGAAPWRTVAGFDLARRVASDAVGNGDMVHATAGGRAIIAVAAPVENRRGAAAVAYVALQDRLRPALKDWLVRSPSSGAFVVLHDGDHLLVATDPPPSTGFFAGQRLPITSERAGALALAAEGGESQVEVRDASGQALWSITRALPQIDGGIVGMVDRDTMLAGLRLTLVGLLLFDVGIGLLGFALLLLWNRQFRARAAEREMELSRRHAEDVQAVLDNAFDAIVSLDADGRVLTANRAASRLFGREAGAMTGKPVAVMLEWEGGGALPRARGAEPWRSVARRPDGSEVAVEYTLARSPETTSKLYTLVVRDVSARVEAEHKVQSFAQGLEVSNRRLEEVNRQLEQASRLKSEFLANTSHELRTPLNGIMGFLQLALDGMYDSPEEEREFLGQALHCSRHLLGLINDVLDIAKIEAGRLNLQIEAVPLATLFDEVYTVTHVQAQQKGLRLVFEPMPADMPDARADFGKIKQVLINLVGNSLKFTPAGSITVRARAHEQAGHVLIEVVDTGIGIPPDRQKMIFEKFIQADGSTTRQYGGTGLGLAITRSLVELMGGVIDVESDGVGKGARMYFTLPVWRGEEDLQAPSESGEAPLPDVIRGPTGGPLVLVVDDDTVYRRLVTTLLHQNGYRTAEAAHAEAGWVLVRRLRPSLVVLDYALSCPEGALLRTGWDLAERMNSDDRTRHIPFLFITGFEGHLLERLRTVTFTRQPLHLEKPVRADDLMAKIVAALGDDPGRIMRVLLADDDPTVAAYVTKVLPSARFQLEVVNNGEECLHLLRTQPKHFDLLLLDLMMPETSGYDVLREMALRGTAAALPVIVLTAYGEPRNEDERRLLEQGLVLEIVSKTDVHERPMRLTEVIEAHLPSITRTAGAQDPLEVERFRAEIPEGDHAGSRNSLGVEHLSDSRPAQGAAADADDTDDERRAA